MTKVIKVKLDNKSLNASIKEIRTYQKSLPERAKKLALSIATEIKSLSEVVYNNAVVENYARNREGEIKKADVNVSLQATPTGYKIVADGDAVWVEFGTGVHFNGPAGSSPHPMGQELGFVIGGYGKGRGKRDVWAFKDGDNVVFTHGAQANPALYEAVKKASTHIAESAKEIFKW